MMGRQHVITLASRQRPDTHQNSRSDGGGAGRTESQRRSLGAAGVGWGGIAPARLVRLH